MPPFALSATDKASVARALAYPYARPGTGSFLYGRSGVPGTHTCFRDEVSASPSASAILSSPSLAGRTAVLAIGSNASPEQLARKFAAHHTADAPIPVLAATLAGWDVVYGALVSGYGSMVATVAPSPCPSTAVSVHVTMLTAEQLLVMHATEGGYLCVRLNPERVKLTLSDVPLYVYVCKFGAVVVNGSAVALAEIPATNRDFVQADQAQMQRIALALTRPRRGPTRAVMPKQSVELKRFVLKNINDKSARVKCSQALRESVWMAGFDADYWFH
jgi:hypothetical protein